MGSANFNKKLHNQSINTVPLTGHTHPNNPEIVSSYKMLIL